MNAPSPIVLTEVGKTIDDSVIAVQPQNAYESILMGAHWLLYSSVLKLVQP